MGTLIIDDDTKLSYCKVRDPAGGTEPLIKCDLESKIRDQNFEILESENLGEWMSKHYKEFGIHLHFISDKTVEGSQFCRSFGGIGGIMRYKYIFDHAIEQEDDSDAAEDFF